MIVKNAVYQYVDEETRIRIIYSSNDDFFAYVNIEANLAVPVLDSIAAIEEEIEKNNIVEIVDPFLQLVEEDIYLILYEREEMTIGILFSNIGRKEK